MHLIHLWPSGHRDSTGRIDPAVGPGTAALFSRSPCSGPRTGHSWEESLWRPVTHSTLSQGSFRHRHLHLVTTQDEHTHIESHRAAVCWLYEKRMSVSGQEKTPPRPSDTAEQAAHCPAVPWATRRFYASEQVFPKRNQESPSRTKHTPPTHTQTYTMCGYCCKGSSSSTDFLKATPNVQTELREATSATATFFK